MAVQEASEQRDRLHFWTTAQFLCRGRIRPGHLAGDLRVGSYPALSIHPLKTVRVSARRPRRRAAARPRDVIYGGGPTAADAIARRPAARNHKTGYGLALARRQFTGAAE